MVLFVMMSWSIIHCQDVMLPLNHIDYLYLDCLETLRPERSFNIDGRVHLLLFVHVFFYIMYKFSIINVTTFPLAFCTYRFGCFHIVLWCL